MEITGFELKWFWQLLLDLHIPQSSPTLLYCESQAAIHITTNLIYPERIKYNTEVDCYFLSDE